MVYYALTLELVLAGPGFNWRAPVGCPTEEEARARLTATFGPGQPSVPVEVHAEVVREEDSGFLLHGYIAGDGQHQALPPIRHAECRDTVVTMTAFMAPFYRPYAIRPRPASRDDRWKTIRLGAAVDVGTMLAYGRTMGAVSPGVQLVPGVQRGRLRVELGLNYAFVRADWYQRTVSLQPRVCGAVIAEPRASLLLCGAFEGYLRLIRHRRHGVSDIQSSWSTIRAGLIVTTWLRPSIGAWLAVEPGLRVLPWGITPTPGRDDPRFTVRVGVGLELRFGGDDR